MVLCCVQQIKSCYRLQLNYEHFTGLICWESFYFFIIPFSNLTPCQNLSFSFQLKLILPLEWPGPEGLGSLCCSRSQRLCGNHFFYYYSIYQFNTKFEFFLSTEVNFIFRMTWARRLGKFALFEVTTTVRESFLFIFYYSIYQFNTKFEFFLSTEVNLILRMTWARRLGKFALSEATTTVRSTWACTRRASLWPRTSLDGKRNLRRPPLTTMIWE